MAAQQVQRALVIGYGSAGARHHRVLRNLGLAVAVVSRRDVDAGPVYRGIPEALDAERPDYVVVANETSEHMATIADLAAADHRGTVMVEKPLGNNADALPRNEFKRLYVGYQLRFHPVVQRLRTLLNNTRPVAVQAYVGQHLTSWRPDRDYTQTYSADAQAGGGVLRDLSHEIDILLWLFGDCRRLAALGGNHDVLDITSDDADALLMETEGCPIVTLQVNYLDRIGRRDLVVNAAEQTFHADLLSGTVRSADTEQRFDQEPDGPTAAMHRAALSGDAEELCDEAEGLAVMRVIAAAQTAVNEGTWVTP